MNNFYYNVLYGTLNRVDYRKYLLLFIGIQIVISLLGREREYDKTLDIILVTFNIIAGIVLYLLSIKRYRDIGHDKPFLVGLLIFIPIVGFFVLFELCMKNGNKISDNVLKLNPTIDSNDNEQKIKHDLGSKKMNIYFKLFCVVLVITVAGILLFGI